MNDNALLQDQNTQGQYKQIKLAFKNSQKNQLEKDGEACQKNIRNALDSNQEHKNILSDEEISQTYKNLIFVSDSTTLAANTGRDVDVSDQIEAYQNLESLIEGAAGSGAGQTHEQKSDRSNLEVD